MTVNELITQLNEIWVKGPTGIWLQRLNNDGSESKASDARRYYQTVKDAKKHHNHMVDVNPNREIAHNLHVENNFGSFVLKLVGKQGEKK